MAVRGAIDKRGLLERALSRAGFVEAKVAPLIEIPLGCRRRVDLGVSREGAALALGLHQAKGGPVVDMLDCALLTPELLALLPALRALLRRLQALRKAGSVIINWLDDGPDILLRLDAEFTGPDKAKIIAYARAENIVRISIAIGAAAPEPVLILSSPVYRFSGVPVEMPPGGFMQPSVAGEAALIAAVLAGLPKLTRKSRIIELFAGAGTFSFALGAKAHVEAYEGDAAAAAAQDKAIRLNNLAGMMRVAQRDLHRRPLQPAEMAGAAAVVLDPPFAGAGAQMRFLAASMVKRVIYVSCNPEALAHDAGQLRHAGYGLVSAVPVDQFPHAETVESVVVFSKL